MIVVEIEKMEKSKRINFKDETGSVYGRLTVVSRNIESKKGKAKWNCLCECGKQTIVDGDKLRRGHTVSCGCYHRDIHTKHGLAGSKIYQVWIGMLSRCYNELNSNYKSYGGRGIAVCDRWINSPENFLEDMGEPGEGMSIDRKDNDGNYSPDNCRWATVLEQMSNTSRNDNIEYDGVVKCLSAWALHLKIPRNTLRNRLYTHNWSIEKAITTPVRFKSK